MTLDRNGLKRVLAAFDEGDWDEIRLDTGDALVHLSTAGHPSAAADTSYVSSPIEPQVSAPSAAGGGLGMDGAPVAAPAAGPAPASAGGLLDVVAPSPGIFWRSPSPGAPPFAEPGARLEADAVLCIVEIMKLMNTVTAPRPGVVAEVLVGNGEEVQHGQVLFRLRPDGS